ncbi:defensin-2-like [Hylaeus volcanicus]|uniref:defensin-2-like n=1 Tax=Hylaeus volcanicus TaxID=313075 RepID=UPI0023B7925D|nr:defensin-2-like [Hylaeus volcanicus]
MKLFVVSCMFVTIACTSVSSAPPLVYNGTIHEFKLKEGSVDDRYDRYEVYETEDVEAETAPPIRHRRVTCDVLSFATLWITVNDAACATRCLTQGRKGGRCQDGVCVCR